MTTNTVIAKVTPLVSTPDVRLYTLSSAEMPPERQTFRSLFCETPSIHPAAHRVRVMHGHFRSIQYP